MKKIFLLAMMAVAFMACENNNGGGGSSSSDVPSGEVKAVKATTEQASDLLGKSPAQVDKSLVAAGFVKLDESELASVIRRIRAKAPKAKADADRWEVHYVYNLPKDFLKMSEEEGLKWMNDQLEAGKSIIAAVAIYYNEELVAMSTAFQRAKTEKINLLYTEISDGLYKDLPSKAMYKEWQGEIGKKEYSDHAAYIAAIGVGESIEAEESGVAADYNQVTGEASGRGYNAYWENPDKEEEASQLRNGLVVPYVIGEFSVVDYAYTQGIVF